LTVGQATLFLAMSKRSHPPHQLERKQPTSRPSSTAMHVVSESLIVERYTTSKNANSARGRDFWRSKRIG